MKRFFDERQLDHAPERELHNGAWTRYAECPSRAESIGRALGNFEGASDHGLEPLLRIHDRDYIDFLQSAHEQWRAAGREGDAIAYTWPVVGRRQVPLSRIDARLGRYSFDAATPIGRATWRSAYWSAQTALSGLAAIRGGAQNAFALCRPPGHHAGADYLGGYCYLNNAAIAAQAARDAGVARVAILDIDYHHGNGTQDIFYERSDIFFASIHANPATDYPFYWGHADERGTGSGSGATLNLPLERGTALADYLAALDEALAQIASSGADLLILSFGADIFEGDPISFFAIGANDFPSIGERIAGSGLPCLILMEGGYAVGDLGGNVARFLSAFD